MRLLSGLLDPQANVSLPLAEIALYFEMYETQILPDKI